LNFVNRESARKEQWEMKYKRGLRADKLIAV